MVDVTSIPRMSPMTCNSLVLHSSLDTNSDVGSQYHHDINVHGLEWHHIRILKYHGHAVVMAKVCMVWAVIIIGAEE